MLKNNRIAVIGIFVAILIIAYCSYNSSKAHVLMTNGVKESIMQSMNQTLLELESFIHNVENPAITNKNDFFPKEIFADIKIITTNINILKLNFTKANEEYKTLESIRRTFSSLESFLTRSQKYFEDSTPFALNSCEEIIFHNKEEIVAELKKYHEVLKVIQERKKSNEITEQWSSLIGLWDDRQASILYRCDLRIGNKEQGM